MISTKQDIQLQTALWGLRRIARKPSSVKHGKKPKWLQGDGWTPPGWTPDGQTCDCAQCIAKDALQQIEEYEKRFFEENLVKTT